MAITDAINCECSETSGSRTFGELRSALYSALGFIDPLSASDKRTLTNLRAQLFRMLGFAAMGTSYPPGMSDLLTDWLNEAQQQLWRMIGLGDPLPSRMTADSHENTLDATAVLAMACYLAKTHYGKPDAKEWKEIALGGIRFPVGGKAGVEQHLKAAHALIYRRYKALHMERFFSWPLTAGVALYDFPANAEACARKLDPYRVKSVHVTDNNGARRPLTLGIPDRAFGYHMEGPPTHYELRSCIHVWPTPEATEGHLIIRGAFEAGAFAADNDQPGVDDELVYLLALANAKAHYKQADAQLVMAQFEVHLGKLVAGSHATARYVPGAYPPDVDYIYTAPKPLVPFQ